MNRSKKLTVFVVLAFLTAGKVSAQYNKAKFDKDKGKIDLLLLNSEFDLVRHSLESIRSDKTLSFDQQRALGQTVVVDFRKKTNQEFKERFANGPRFDCLKDLNKSKSIKIVFWGEQHESNFATTTASRLKEQVNKKTLVAAFEGMAQRVPPSSSLTPLYYDDEFLVEKKDWMSSSYAWGLEDPVFKALADATVQVRQGLPPMSVRLTHDEYERLDGARRNVFESIVKFPHFRELYKEARPSMNSDNLLVKALDALSKTPHRQTWSFDEVFQTFQNVMQQLNIQLEDPKTFRKLPALEASWKPVFHALFRQAYVRALGAERAKKDKALVDAFLAEPLKSDFALQVPVMWRDMQFAANLVDAFCFANRQGVDLHVSMGFAHIAGTKRYLSLALGEQSYEIDVNVDPIILNEIR